MYENLDSLWRDHEFLMEAREALYREFLVVSPTPEMDLALLKMDEAEQDIWNQLTWYEQKVGAMEREIYRAQRRSDRAHDAAEQAQQQLGYCIEEAPPATPGFSVTRP